MIFETYDTELKGELIPAPVQYFFFEKKILQHGSRSPSSDGVMQQMEYLRVPTVSKVLISDVFIDHYSWILPRELEIGSKMR